MTSFDFAEKAGRFLFSRETEYAGKLIAVTERSIENMDSNILLLRIEFEIFLIDDASDPFELHPTAAVASRDLVVTRGAGSDEGLARYAAALGVKHPNNVKHWYRLEHFAQIKTPARQRWIRICFGEPNVDGDFRQPFVSVSRLDAPKNSQMKSSSTVAALRDPYVKPLWVRNLLRNKRGTTPSEDTVNVFVDRHAEQYADKLLRHTPGGHRRINWYLCWHLWEAAKL